jgi:hypothetical protein
MELIEAAAKTLGLDKATIIWNSEVDKKLVPAHRQSYYWKEPT